MAQQLGLKECEPLLPDSFGVVGNLETELSASEFAAKVKDAFGVDKIRCSVPLEGKLRRVAVCGGSGKSFIPEAMASGAQVYVTGDITYHEFYTEKGFMVMDIGHYSSEYGIVGLFANILSENFPTFAVSISKENNNPIYYY
jgi:putative NIF3 family GTP cyclohydrolase 1 type 2